MSGLYLVVDNPPHYWRKIVRKTRSTSSGLAAYLLDVMARDPASQVREGRWFLVEANNSTEARQLAFWYGSPPSGKPEGRLLLHGPER